MSSGFTPTYGTFNNPFTPKWSTTGYQTDASGRPLMPSFNTIGDPETGLLRGPYNLQSTLNESALNAARNEATRDPGTMSRWGQMALSQASNAAAQQGASQLQTAKNQLAASGGLRTGAAERLASAGAQNQLLAGQNALQNVQMQDEANRQKWMSLVPGMDLQRATYTTNLQDRNIGRAMGEIGAGRDFSQNQYNEAMKSWAAEQMARAAGEGGGGGGFGAQLGGAWGTFQDINNPIRFLDNVTGGKNSDFGRSDIGKFLDNPAAAIGIKW